MKIIKYLVIAIIGLIAVVCILGLIAPKDFAIEREVTINKPKDQVFAYLKEVKNQDNYSIWNKRDPNMKKSFRGTDGTVGFVAVWDSQDKNVGAGEQEIKSITEGSRIDMELRFTRPFESTSQAYMSAESAGEGQTKVKWGFNGKMPYPMNAMMLFMNMDKEAGKDLGDGLANLKAVLEQ